MVTSELEPYYHSRGDGRFESTVHAQGAWNPHEQHMAPVAGILAHSLELFQPRPELRIARISYDILGLIPGGEFDIATTMLRPGRTIELVQAELDKAGKQGWELVNAVQVNPRATMLMLFKRPG